MVNGKALAVGLFSLLLCGCALNGNAPRHTSDSRYSSEQVLRTSGNHQELIKLYKTQLKEKESADVRLKLVSTYLDSKDYESALFYVEPLLKQNPPLAQAYFLAGKAHYSLGQIDDAVSLLTRAAQLDEKNGEIENLLGVAMSIRGDFDKAREWFTLARQNMYSDMVVKNNLAMLDLIEGQCIRAANRLLPLVNQENASKKVWHNLALAYAQCDMKTEFTQLLSEEKYTQKEIDAIYLQLAHAEFKQLEGPQPLEVVQ